jgi:3-deoxy-7-phosphoheptulonate synthase
MSEGNYDVILCERGIRTFETATRNTLDISAVPVLKSLSHLPVFVDPSHAAGKAHYVPSLSKAAIAAGADGLIIEVHPNPNVLYRMLHNNLLLQFLTIYVKIFLKLPKY